MKKNFLKAWTGGINSFGLREEWKRAQGSSLSENERSIVESGGIAFHKKGSRDTKVFAQDEDHEMWSVTVMDLHLADLKNRLKEVGYIIPTA